MDRGVCECERMGGETGKVDELTSSRVNKSAT
ncbi:Uncharacterised protein [Chlamydia trachomatis]|nr:Uncharacterised protein [Chlamydia trachomatis]